MTHLFRLCGGAPIRPRYLIPLCSVGFFLFSFLFSSLFHYNFNGKKYIFFSSGFFFGHVYLMHVGMTKQIYVCSLSMCKVRWMNSVYFWCMKHERNMIFYQRVFGNVVALSPYTLVIMCPETRLFHCGNFLVGVHFYMHFGLLVCQTYLILFLYFFSFFLSLI